MIEGKHSRHSREHVCRRATRKVFREGAATAARITPMSPSHALACRGAEEAPLRRSEAAASHGVRSALAPAPVATRRCASRTAPAPAPASRFVTRTMCWLLSKTSGASSCGSSARRAEGRERPRACRVHNERAGPDAARGQRVGEREPGRASTNRRSRVIPPSQEFALGRSRLPRRLASDPDLIEWSRGGSNP